MARSWAALVLFAMIGLVSQPAAASKKRSVEGKLNASIHAALRRAGVRGRGDRALILGTRVLPHPDRSGRTLVFDWKIKGRKVAHDLSNKTFHLVEVKGVGAVYGRGRVSANVVEVKPHEPALLH
jgi:hypothetical protein